MAVDRDEEVGVCSQQHGSPGRSWQPLSPGIPRPPCPRVVPGMGLDLAASCRAKPGPAPCGQWVVAPRGFSP